ncbi:helix-turn-helix transcriptional regulator [Blastococcus sp. TF02A-26]|uniref:ArsR/SmtB family transcription factor n=1 Tax=Blastococcus sp. TF02A-26 TaxID=2250577 RepID=UPI000DEBF93C|nr:metalloregulator ArsR/SmtB family transcription factor [Blastococcus sp. TF02A-26]RBY81895.1 transcriptional regulator [Blastococcus sp. TF02A-26]
MNSSRTGSELPLVAGGDACAPAGLSGGLSTERAADLARTLKALADPARLRLLSLIAASPSGEACICDLTGPLELSQPTVSHHCKVLVDAGFLRRDKRGVWAHYSLVPGAMRAVGAELPGVGALVTA